MGHGIAQIFAVHGHPVWIIDSNENVLNSVKNRVRENLKNMVNHGFDIGSNIEEILDRIRLTADLMTACKNCDFVFEAVSENLKLKQQIFTNLDDLCPLKCRFKRPRAKPWNTYARETTEGRPSCKLCGKLTKWGIRISSGLAFLFLAASQGSSRDPAARYPLRP